MGTVWLVNGLNTGVDPADRGLAYGDGLFETIAAQGGRIRWLEYHLERLAEGCRRLQIAPVDWRALRRELTAHCPPAGDHVIKLILTRGAGERGYHPPQPALPTRILGIAPWPAHPPSHYTAGIRLASCELRLAESEELAGMKHLCRLEQVLAQLELAGLDAEEGLLRDTSGYVVGGVSCNVFAVTGGQLTTPALTRCGVHGVMRRVVLETARALGMQPVERDILPDTLYAADELFVTNAVSGIRPVRALDHRTFVAGEITASLMQRLGYAPDA